MPTESSSNDQLVTVLTEIRNWMRAAAHKPVKALLEEALPDTKSRMAYQMLDGTNSTEQVRKTCKMSPNAVIALAGRCTALGPMRVGEDKKRSRLFDLRDFGLLPEAGQHAPEGSQ